MPTVPAGILVVSVPTLPGAKWSEFSNAGTPLIRLRQFDPSDFGPEENALRIKSGVRPYNTNTGAQAQFFGDLIHRYCGVAMGWRGGKSWIGARKLVLLHLLNAIAPDGSMTGVGSLVVSPTFTAARTYNIPQIQEALRDFNLPFEFKAHPMRFWFHVPVLDAPQCESLIYVRSAQIPAAIAGFEVGAIWGDEAPRWKDDPDDPAGSALVQCEGRLSAPKARIQQTNLTFTQEGDGTRIYERFVRSRRPDHGFYRGSARENKAVQAATIDSIAANLTKELAEQYVEGGVASYRGELIYKHFDEHRNVDEKLVLDQRYPIFVSLDFNVTPGSHSILGQHRDGKICIVHEFFWERAAAREHAENLARWMKENLYGLPQIGARPWRFPGVLDCFGDASGKSATLANGKSAWEEVAAAFTAAQIEFTMGNVPAANPHVADRAATVNSGFKNALGEVRISIHPRCERLIADFRRMRWEGNQEDKRDRNLSHTSSCLGYVCVQLLPIRV